MLWRILPVLLMSANTLLPNKEIQKMLTKAFYACGVCLTLGASKSRMVGPVWNRTIEPIVVDLLDNVTIAIKEGLIQGLRSDNVSSSPESPPPQESEEPQES